MIRQGLFPGAAPTVSPGSVIPGDFITVHKPSGDKWSIRLRTWLETVGKGKPAVGHVEKRLLCARPMA